MVLSIKHIFLYSPLLAPKTPPKKTMVHGLGWTVCNRFIRSIKSVATVVY